MSTYKGSKLIASNNAPIVVSNLMLGDLKSNTAKTQKTIISSGQYIICDGVTKLYPKGTVNQNLYYENNLLDFMEINYPDNVDNSKVITMPKIHENGGYKKVPNEFGESLHYDDGRLDFFSIPLGHKVLIKYPVPFTKILNINMITTRNNNLIGTKWLTHVDVDQDGYVGTTVSSLTEFEVTNTTTYTLTVISVNGYWKEYIPRYQYMCVKYAAVPSTRSNTNSYGIVKVNDILIPSTEPNDKLTLVAGKGITLTPNIADKSIKIESEGETGTYEVESLIYDETTKELVLKDSNNNEFNVDLSSLAGGDSGGSGGVSEEELNKLKKQVDALYIYDSYTVPSKKWLISDEIMPFKINGSNILRLKQGNPKDNKSFKGLPVDSADSSNGIIAFYISQEDMLYMSVIGENGAAGRLHLNSISCRIEAGFFTNIGDGKSGNLRLVSATPDSDLTIDLSTGSTRLQKLYDTFRKGQTVGIDYEISTDVDYITEIDCRDYPNGVYIIWDAKFKNHGRITYSVIYHDFKTSVMGNEFTDDDFYDENWKPNNIPQLEHGVEYNRDMIVRYDQKIWRVSAWKFTYYRQGFFPTDILELYPKPDVRNLPQILDYNEISKFTVQGISTHIPGFGTNITMTITAFGNSMTNGVLEDVPFGNNLSREELDNLQGSTVFTSSLQEEKYAAIEIFFPHDNMQRCRISIKRTMDNAPNFGWYRYNKPFTFHFTLPPLGVK